jgi:hypothetical protein
LTGRLHPKVQQAPGSNLEPEITLYDWYIGALLGEREPTRLDKRRGRPLRAPLPESRGLAAANGSGVTVSPMRPWQNALAIVAAFLVAGALLPWELRLACAFGAIGIVLLLFVFRVRSHSIGVAKKRTSDVYGQVERLRAARKERLQRKIRQ